MLGTRNVVLWQIGKTDKAYKFSTLPGDAGSKDIWIPRSVIHHISRDPNPSPERQPTRCTCEVEEWFLDKNEL